MGINRNKVLAAARKQVRKGNWEKAIDKYTELVDDDPSDARSLLKIADLYSKLDRREEALDAYQAVANHYAGDDIYEKAVAVYKQALRLAPDEPELHRDLGDAYHRLGRLKDAVRSYHKAQKIYKAQGDAASHRELLERMIRLDPDDVGMRIQLAERYAKDDLHDQALELFEFAADKLDAEGRIDEFVQVAERIIYFKDEAIGLRRRVVDIYLSRGDNKHALKHLQVCFKKRPQDIGILELLIEAFERLERYDKAVLVMHELASLYCQQSREDEAAQIYQRVLEIDPDDGRAKKRLRQMRRLDDSGVMTGRRDTGPIDKHRNHTPAEPHQVEDAQVDALDGIEFLDEEDDDELEVVEVHEPAQQPQQPQQPQQSSGQSQPPTPEQRPRQPQVPQAQDEGLVDISGEIEVIEAVEPTIEHDGPQTTEDQVKNALKETDVFIKYGLHDKAYETIVGVIAKHPDSVVAREQMKKLQLARGNTAGAVDELLEMARITRTTPSRAQGFISEALELTDDLGRVHQAAEQFGLTGAGVDDAELDEISMVELDALDEVDALDDSQPVDSQPVADSQPAEPAADPDLGDAADLMADQLADELGHEMGDEMSAEMLDLDMGEIEFIEGEPDEVDPADLEAHFHEVEQSVVEMSEIELDADDVQLIEDTDAEMVEVADDELGFDETAFDDADVVDMDVDDLGELSDDQMVALDDDAADAAAADEGGFGFDLTEEEADSMFDDLFGDFDGASEASVNLGGDDPLGELAEVDFFLQQGLVSEAEETLDRVREENPEHSGLQKRADQIDQARQGLPPEDNPFGARSLSQKFHPGLEHDEAPSLDLGQAAFHNTSIELGTAYRDMGLFDEAIDEFKQALDDPQAADAATYHIALCEIEKGDTTTATERLQQLLQRGQLSQKLRQAAQEKLAEMTA